MVLEISSCFFREKWLCNKLPSLPLSSTGYYPIRPPPHKYQKVKVLVTQSYWILYNPMDSFQPHGLQPARPFYPWNSEGKDTGVGSS